MATTKVLALRMTIVAAGVLPAMGLSCGGDDGSGPTEALVQETQFWERWRAATCDGYGACCGAHQMAFRRDQCIYETTKAYGPSSTACSEGFAYDPDAGTACLKEIERTYAECREVRVVDICWNVCKRSPADKLPGDRCASSRDCKYPQDGNAGSTICSNGSLDPGPSHTCVFVPRGQVGSTCYATCGGSECASWSPRPELTNPAQCLVSDGLFCDKDKDWTCQPQRGPGESASSSMECQAGTHFDVDSVPAICTPNLPLGSACKENDCEAGAYCERDPSMPASPTGTCSTKKDAGETCESNLECKFGCGTERVCLLEPGAPFEVTAAMCQAEPGALKFH